MEKLLILLRPLQCTALLLLIATLAGGSFLSGCNTSRASRSEVTSPEETSVNSGTLFVDQRSAAGIDFPVANPKVGLTILETLGHGAALCDFDGDGNLDLVLLGVDRVALHRGDGKFHFTDVTAASGLGQQGRWHGAATGDFDGDGRVDLYLCGYGRSALYRNLGGMQFGDVTQSAGVHVRPAGRDGIPEWRSSAAFVDIDHDGRLDLYVLRYAQFGPRTPQLCDKDGVPIACDPTSYDSQRGVLYRNLGNGKFADETLKRGLDKASGHALGITCADFDGDGLIDIAVANDERPGDLFRNRGKGQFEQNGPQSGTAFDAHGHVHAGMGIDSSDYDRDSRMDLFVTTFEKEEKNLYRNLGSGVFMDNSLNSGLSKPLQPWISWGTRFLDYDNDGWLDLLVANGHVHDTAKRINPQTDYPQPLILLRNKEGGRSFVNVSSQAGPAFQKPLVGRAVCTGDIDNDGGIDVVVTNAEGQPLLLRNTASQQGHWLSVGLQGPLGNHQGIGARITLQTSGGKRIHDVSTAGGFMAANDARAHFGLGHKEQIRSISVRWPDGSLQQFGTQPKNQHVRLRYKPGQVKSRQGQRVEN